MFIIVHPHSIIDIYHSHESWDVFYFTTSCASDRAAVASRPGSVRAFSILEPPISTKTPWKSRPKRKLLKLYHTTYLFRKPPFQKKKARTNQKFRAPGRNLSDFCWGHSNGLKVEATKIGRATWARCTRIDTSVDDMDDMESHSDPVDWPQKNRPNHPRSQACGRLSRVTIDNLYFPPVGTQPKWPHPKAASEASHKV